MTDDFETVSHDHKLQLTETDIQRRLHPDSLPSHQNVQLSCAAV